MHQPSSFLHRSSEPPLRPVNTPRQALLVCAIAVTSCIVGAMMCVVAVALHPPVAVMPFVLILCIGGPVFGTWELPRALTVLHAHRPGRHARAVASFRASLALLPEVEHPLGH